MRTVLITGGSRGIGSAMVRRFSKNGYAVAFTYNKSRDAAEALSKETGALAIKADNASECEILAAVSEVREKLGDIDVLINNAAVSSFSVFTDISYEDWNNIFAVNLGGAFLYSKAVLSDMIKNKSGRIINISSVWGNVGASMEVAYSASKGAVNSFTKALAKELAPSNVQVNAISCGVIDTEMNEHLSEEERLSLIDEIPACRMGTPKEVGELALLLANAPAYLTGQIITMDGGLL